MRTMLRIGWKIKLNEYKRSDKKIPIRNPTAGKK